MNRVFNFSAGPAALPLSVLERAQSELTDYQGTGMSVMEMSHRSPVYMSIIEHARTRVRELTGTPDNYHVLFLQGGASCQFTMVPMNLIGDGQGADYVHTGVWSGKAIKEARKLCDDIHVAASTEPEGFTRTPRLDEITPRPEAAYLHLTTNNTIYGTEFSDYPDTGDVPLVVDASSNILSRPLDISRFGLLYAGAQKNLGPSGVTLVLVRDDLIGKKVALPAMLDYGIHAAKESMFNTPPTYAIYLLGLVLDWMHEQGGVSAIEQRNKRQAEALYAAVDGSDFYRCPIEQSSRSRMNIPFKLEDESRNDAFLAQAAEAGLVNLKGHRLVGGMRASLYNAMSDEAVDALIAFMKDFARRNG